MELIPTILSLLDVNPLLKYQWEKSDHLAIKSTTTNKRFEVSFWEKENTLYFESWHWHYENATEDEDLVSAILDIITNKAMLKVVKKGEKVIRTEMGFSSYTEGGNLPLTTGFLGINLKSSNEFEYQKVIFI